LSAGSPPTRLLVKPRGSEPSNADRSRLFKTEVVEIWVPGARVAPRPALVQAGFVPPITIDVTHPLVALALAVALVGLLLLWRLAAGRARRTGRRNQRLGARAERGAERLLERAGYRVLDRQAQARWPIEVDGARIEALARADLLVGRGRRRYVAEVKTGPGARPDHPDTRRQLLEYLLAFDVDGVLLVDVEARSVLQIAFPDLPR
jgi:hypothetical protein